MNWIDVLLLGIIVFSIWSGWQKGFILGTLNLFTWLGSLVVAFYGYPFLTSFIQHYTAALGVWTQPVAFLLLLIFTRILIAVLSNQLLKGISYETQASYLNRSLGTIPGVFQGLINASIVTFLLLAFPLFAGLSENIRNSSLANKLVEPAEWAEAKLAPVFDKAVNKTMNRITVEPKSNETVKLPYKVMHPKVREDLEAKMLELVNEERTNRGLSPLKADPQLAAVARAHSRDMFARSYFSHYTPEGKDPFDRMKAAGVRFLTAGENLALAQTLPIAHDGLMKSPGHRANILQPAFGRLGIGILDGGFYGLMISQEFRN